MIILKKYLNDDISKIDSNKPYLMYIPPDNFNKSTNIKLNISISFNNYNNNKNYKGFITYYNKQTNDNFTIDMQSNFIDENKPKQDSELDQEPEQDQEKDKTIARTRPGARTRSRTSVRFN